MSAASVGQIGLDLVVNQGQFQKQMNGITSMAKKAGAVIAGAFAVKKIFDFGKEAVKLGSDLTEVQNVVDVTFSQMSNRVDQFAKDAAASFGLSETMAKKYVGTFGAMSKAFGFSEAEAYKMSTALTGLAGDVASFYNISQDEAYTKLKSVFTGETETLKDLGVVMTQSALDAYALANGYGKVTAKMSEAEKVALRFAFVQDQLSLANGDFARTSDQWANQVRILQLQMQSFMATVGQGLINIFSPAIKVINLLMGKLIALANLFKAFTEAITGKSGGGGVSSGMEQTGAAAESAAGGMTDAGSAAGGAAKKTKKAAKEIKGSLAGFDEINVLQKTPEATDAGAGTGGISGGVGAVDTGIDFGAGSTVSPDVNTAVSNMLQLLEPLKQISFDNLSVAFGRLKEAIAPLTQTLFAGLHWAYMNIFVPLAKWTIEDALPAFLDVLSGALSVLNSVIGVLKPIFLWLWDNFLQPIAAWTGGVIVSVLGLIADALNRIATWIQNNTGYIQNIIVLVTAFFAAWEVTKLMAFIQMAGGVGTALAMLKTQLIAHTIALIKDKAETIALTLMYAKDFVVSVAKAGAALAANIANWVAETAAKVASTAATVAHTVATTAATAATTALGVAISILTSPITLVIAAVAALVAGIVLLIKHWDDVKKAAEACWGKIKEVWAAVSTWFNETVVEPVKGFFSGLWTDIKTFGSDAWNNIKLVWEKAQNFFNNKVINPIKNAFKNGINAMIGFAEGFVNRFIRGINKIVDAINSISFDLPDILGGGHIGFNLPRVKEISLPRLATGAVIPPNSEFLAMLGDQKRGRNLEAPEGLIRQIMREEMAGFGGGDIHITIEASANEGQLIRYFSYKIKQEDNRKGKVLIQGVTV